MSDLIVFMLSWASVTLSTRVSTRESISSSQGEGEAVPGHHRALRFVASVPTRTQPAHELLPDWRDVHTARVVSAAVITRNHIKQCIAQIKSGALIILVGMRFYSAVPGSDGGSAAILWAVQREILKLSVILNFSHLKITTIRPTRTVFGQLMLMITRYEFCIWTMFLWRSLPQSSGKVRKV